MIKIDKCRTLVSVFTFAGMVSFCVTVFGFAFEQYANVPDFVDALFVVLVCSALLVDVSRNRLSPDHPISSDS